MLIKFLQKYSFFFIIALSSCGESTTIKRPDVAAIHIDVKVERFDQEFSNLKPAEILTKNTKWQQQYPYFYTDYMTEMLEVGSPKDSLYIQDIVSKVIQRKEFVDLATAVSKKFPDLRQQEKELTQAFKYLIYYFPEYETPRLISFIGGFSFQTPIGEDYVGIGLDMFLGADSEFYPALIKSIPLYLSRKFTPENISPRVIETILREEIYPQNNINQNTLGHMVYNGKLLYAMDVVLETTKDEDKIGYTSEQLLWAQRYQEDIWRWFLQENLLYDTDYLKNQKFFTDAPFTPELGENNESAPKLGSYMGWMLVRKYMERNPEVGLKELFAMDDPQQILEESKFKGK